jgi:CHAD domain-containing protein
MNAQSAPDRLMTRRLRALADTLPAAVEGDVSGVHKARVASRRVREALPVVLAQASSKKSRRLKRAFQEVTRVLGPLREADVTLGLARGLAKERPDTADALAWVTRGVEAERQQLRERMRATIDEMDFEALVDRIDTAMHAGPHDPEDERALGAAMAAALAIRVSRRVRDLRRAIEAAGALYAPEPIHLVRIAVKKLRYALELAYDLKLLHSRRPVTQLKAAQDTLGRLHDDQMLLTRVAQTQSRLSPRERDTIDTLDEVVRVLEARCREEHARYMHERDRMLWAASTALDELTTATPPRAEPESAGMTIH